MAPRTVRLYLDFVSPYVWLALLRLRSFSEAHAIEWQIRPVVYARLLDANGLLGPAEVPAKRSYTLIDVSRLAGSAGYRLTGPPAHPFRSLEALRTVCLFENDPRSFDLAVALADAAWGRGRDLTDSAVLEDLVDNLGLDSDGLSRRIAAPRIKTRLRRWTDEAIQAGIFGVPTFVFHGERFWGHDRMDALARRLEGEPAPDSDVVDRILRRPSGTRRRGMPPETGS